MLLGSNVSGSIYMLILYVHGRDPFSFKHHAVHSEIRMNSFLLLENTDKQMAALKETNFQVDMQ